MVNRNRKIKKPFLKIFLFTFILSFFYLFFSCDLLETSTIKKQNYIKPEYNENIIKNYIDSKDLDKILELSIIYPEILIKYKNEIFSLFKRKYKEYEINSNFLGLINIYLNINSLYLLNFELKEISSNQNVFGLSYEEIKYLKDICDDIKNILSNFYYRENNYFYKLAFYKYFTKYVKDINLELPKINNEKKINNFEDIISNVVTIYNDKGFKVENGYEIPDIMIGTAFYIDYNLLVTNYHVVDNEGKAFNDLYVLIDGQKIKCNVLYKDEEHDISVLRINYSNKKFKYFDINENIGLGEEVIACGSPYGLEHTFTRGIISNKSRKILPLVSSYQSDAALNPGNSGGPVIDKNFKLIGISFAGIQNAQNLNFIIPVSYFLDTLIYSKLSDLPKRSWIGFYYRKNKIIYGAKNLVNYLKLKKLYQDEDINKENTEFFTISSINGIKLEELNIINFEDLQKYIYNLPSCCIINLGLMNSSGKIYNYNFYLYNRNKDINIELYKYDIDVNLITPYLGIIFYKKANELKVKEVMDELLVVFTSLQKEDTIKKVLINIDARNGFIKIFLEVSLSSKNNRTYYFSFLIPFYQEWFI
jgi:S1-C subfamily serine protease